VTNPPAPKLIVPDTAVRYLLLQRTHLQRWSRVSRYLRVPYHPHVLRLEAWGRGSAIKKRFAEQISEEYAQLKAFLPQKISAFLDIGCGIGGMPLMLYRHYHFSQGVEGYLLDRTKIAKKLHYGFGKRGVFYNSLRVAREFLIRNGVDRNQIRLMTAANDFKIPMKSDSVDLVLSLKSWGYHYPVAAYLPEVYRVIRRGGTLIVDIRCGTGGEEELMVLFRDMRVISTDARQIRYAFSK